MTPLSKGVPNSARLLDGKPLRIRDLRGNLHAQVDMTVAGPTCARKLQRSAWLASLSGAITWLLALGRLKSLKPEHDGVGAIQLALDRAILHVLHLFEQLVLVFEAFSARVTPRVARVA